MNATPKSAFSEDNLGVEEFAKRLEEFLIGEHDFVDGSLVVSLAAPFGSGKTTFLSMWKRSLEERRADDAKVPKVIMLNAWESDFCGDPLLAIISGLISATNGDVSTEEGGKEQLKEAAKDVAWFCAAMGSQLASHWTGLDPIAAGELAKAKKGERLPERPDFIELYHKRMESLNRLRDRLQEVFGGDRVKVFVFVDELDRCRPDYAISYLETIKHVFDIRGLVFVLAVDYDQLASSAGALFGHSLKFPEYFRKFVHRSIPLKAPDEPGIRRLVKSYVHKYVVAEGQRISGLNLQHLDDHIVALVQALRLTTRQIQEVFRIAAHVTSRADDKKLLYNIGVGVFFMAALKLARSDLFERIGCGNQSHKEMAALFREWFPEHAEWWFCVYVTAQRQPDDSSRESLVDIFKQNGFERGDDATLSHELAQFSQHWGHSTKGRFKEIWNKIETVDTYK